MADTARSGQSPLVASTHVERFESLLVPHDLTLLADRVLPVVGSLARRGRLGIRLLTTASAGLEEYDRAELADHARRIHGCPVMTDVVESDDASMDIADYAQGHPDALLCLATHGRTALGELLLGSMTDDLLRRHVGPILVVGPRTESDWTFGDNIIACVAADTATDPLMDAVAAWRATFGGTVQLFEAIDRGRSGGSEDRALTTELEAARARFPDASVTTVNARDPVAAILEAADGSGSIVAVGSRGRRGIERAVLGSVSWEVIRSASTPVLVVPAPRSE